MENWALKNPQVVWPMQLATYHMIFILTLFAYIWHVCRYLFQNDTFRVCSVQKCCTRILLQYLNPTPTK
jgi:hypothetical protein